MPRAKKPNSDALVTAAAKEAPKSRSGRPSPIMADKEVIEAIDKAVHAWADGEIEITYAWLTEKIEQIFKRTYTYAVIRNYVKRKYPDLVQKALSRRQEGSGDASSEPNSTEPGSVSVDMGD